MKSEHRHELKTNELSRWATQVGHSTEKYTNQIIAGAVGLVLLAGIGIYWQSSSRAARSAGWNEMAAAQSAEDFANIADKYPGTSVAAWASLREGELHLNSGMRLAFTDRASGMSDLKKARDAFEKLVKDDSVPADAKERALFGLGRCLETLSDKNTEEAIAVYQRLITEYSYSAYKNVAEARIAALRLPGAHEFYAWWHEQNPKPVDRELPRDLSMPGGALLNPNTAAAPLGDDEFPKTSGDGKSDPTKAAPVEKSDEKSEAPKAPESDAKKAAEKPAASPTPEKAPEKSDEPAKKE